MDNSVQYQLSVPLDHVCYADHFPGEPIVPAALFMQWVIEAVSKSFPDYVVDQVKSMKFLAVVKPGDECVLHLSVNAAKQSIKVEAHRSETLLCKGSMKFS